MASKRYQKKVSKYHDDAIILASIVDRIELQNIEKNGKFKTVFYCKSNTLPEGRLCIVWGRTKLETGQKFEAKGRLTPEGTFLVWSMNTWQRG